MADIQIKGQISVDTGNSAAAIKSVKDNLQGAGDAMQKTNAAAGGSSQTFSKLKGELGQLTPGLGQASQGVGALTAALNVLKANPIIGIFVLIAGLVVALFQRFKQMEGVSDSLGKAFGTLSGVIGTFLDKVLTPLIDAFTWLVDNLTNGIIFVLDKLGLASAETANRLGDIVEALDDLEDAEKDSAIAMAESNRKLQEAREIAGDANVPIRERIEALKLAAKIEKEEIDKVVLLNQTKAKLMLESIALESNARQGLIDKIREGSLESLKAARAELAAMKNIDKERLYEIDKMIIAAEDNAAQSAKIGKKTQSQITSMEKEENDKRVAIAKEAAEKKRKIAEDAANEEKKFQQMLTKAQQEAAVESNKNAFEAAKIKLQQDFEAKQKEIELLKVTEDKKKQLFVLAQEDFFRERNKILVQQQAAEDAAKQVQAEKEAAEKAAKEQAEAERVKRLADQFLANNAAQQKAAKEAADTELAIAKAKEEGKVALVQNTQNALTAFSNLVGKETVAGKALAVAASLIDTYRGIAAAVKLGFPAAIPAAAAAAATGFGAVKNILKTKVPGASGDGGGGNTATPVTVAAPVTPQQLSTQLNAASIQGIGNAAAGGINRAFVLDADISNSQERQAKLQRAARLG